MFSEVFAQPDVPVITEKEDTDTAIYVLSRNSGEGADRYNRACDYLLGENELADIAYLAEHYEKTVLILNIANLVDTTELKKNQRTECNSSCRTGRKCNRKHRCRRCSRKEHPIRKAD